MSLINRAVVFVFGTISNAVLFIVFSRAYLTLKNTGLSISSSGPGTEAMNLLPTAIVLAMGILQIGLVVYLLGGLGEERTVQRGPM
jgi:hypothetical protein